jgi:anti-sigma B factor antagonist
MKRSFVPGRKSRKEEHSHFRDLGMQIKSMTVSVKQLPEKFSVQQGRVFFREVASCLNSDRPRVVLDCSKLQQLDSAGIHVLLRCLEEAMKRNGDVKLAALPPAAAATLELTGVNRLFQTFDNTADAVNSFQQLPVYGFQHALGLAYSNLPQQNTFQQPLGREYSTAASESTA